MKKRSLVLVTVDCLRADHVGFQRYSRPVTPFLDSLARDSAIFSDAIVAGVPTYFSVPAILASRYPLSLGRDVLGIAPNEPSIPTALRGAGYRTAAFLAGNPYLSPRFGYDQGFDTFEDFQDLKSGESVRPLPSGPMHESSLNRRLQAATRGTRFTAAAYDELYFWYCQLLTSRENVEMESSRRYPAANFIIDRACSWLGSLGDEPFFLWIHLMDPHYPYCPPLEALSFIGESQITARRARFLNSCWNRRTIDPRRLRGYLAEIIALYDAGIYWVDQQMSRLVSALRQSQRWEETIFVLTADHGEEFLEHGARYHSPMNLPEQLIHVPLLLRAPELSGRRISNVPFSLIHLAPTLLETMGVAIPNSFQGRSYWGEIQDGILRCEPAIAEAVGTGDNPLRREERMTHRVMSVRDARYKLVIRFGENRDYLYDLETDPEERSPLPDGALRRERGQLLQVAHAHLQRTKQKRNAEFELGLHVRRLQQSMLYGRRVAEPAPVRNSRAEG